MVIKNVKIEYFEAINVLTFLCCDHLKSKINIIVRAILISYYSFCFTVFLNYLA